MRGGAQYAASSGATQSPSNLEELEDIVRQQGRNHTLTHTTPEAALRRLPPPPTLISKKSKAPASEKGARNTPVYSANLAVRGISSGGSLPSEDLFLQEGGHATRREIPTKVTTRAVPMRRPWASHPA
ncbi:hypothetical protein BHE74_00006320 [Ensete ventricosum]|nr:hypothetical protein GW17_00008590 [Ensete ventricosum]RWW85037.1 hypothetical protein BHE74_00006320 [Ensete ventricosum]